MHLLRANMTCSNESVDVFSSLLLHQNTQELKSHNQANAKPSSFYSATAVPNPCENGIDPSSYHQAPPFP